MQRFGLVCQRQLILICMTEHYKFLLYVIMAALRSRCGHYIFALWFLSFFFLLFSSPNLSGRRLDVYHTSTYDVDVVRI